MSDNGHETSSPIGFVQNSYRSLEVSFFCFSLLLCVLAARRVVLLVNGIALSAVGMEALQEGTDPLPAPPDLAEVRSYRPNTVDGHGPVFLSHGHSDGAGVSVWQTEDSYPLSTVPSYTYDGEGLPTQGVSGVLDGGDFTWL